MMIKKYHNMSQRARKFKKIQTKKARNFLREITFLAVLNFFPVRKMIFGWPFLKLQKMEFGQKICS